MVVDAINQTSATQGSHVMYIKAISSTIPGINPKYGELYPTKKILEAITREESNLDPLFIQKACGIKTVALTHDTLQAVKEKNPYARNNTLYEMLDNSIGECLTQLTEKEGSGDSKIKFHIHIIGVSEPIVEFRIKAIRRKYQLSPDISTFFISQGCSGFLEALGLAKVILASEKEANILVTAENNMITHIHDRYTRYANAENLDHWLWQVIFGEGVGAAIIGNSDKSPKCGRFWKIVHFEKRIACDDWRVTEMFHNGKPQIYIKAREVRQTYLKSIPEELIRGVSFFEENKNIAYILHESNPKILQKVINDMGMGLEDIPSISAEVGTLACVSSFSLLDRVNIKQHAKDCYTNIVMALIGEAQGNISSGFICLSPYHS